MANLYLPHGESDPSKVYSFPDPTSEEYTGAEWKARYASDTLTRSDLLVLASASAAYRSLCAYELGQENCVRKLRDIWRALRKRKETTDDPKGEG